MPAKLPAILLLLCFHFSNAQYFSKEKQLIDRVAAAKNEKASLKSLGELAEFYYLFRAEKKGDSVLQKQIFNAELSNDKNLMLDALFGDAIENIPNWSSAITFDKAIDFVDRGINYARNIDRPDYEAIGYLRKAAIFRKRAEYDKALQQSLIAISSFANLKNDSLKSAIFLETGDIFLAKREAVSAYKNYNNAFDLAYQNKDVKLQSDCYHHFANLYHSLGDEKKTKESLLKSLELNTTWNNKPGILEDYRDLARFTDEPEYIDRLLTEAKKINSTRYLLAGKILRFAYLMVVKNDSKTALQYLYSNEDLNQYYLNTGTYNYYWNLGNVYNYSNRPDSAIYYYTLAEPGLQKGFEASVQKSMYKEMGHCYTQLKNYNNAIACYEKALAISEKQKDYANASTITGKLSGLYANTNDYKQAFVYNEKNNFYKDTVQQMNAQREVVLLEVDRETKKHEEDMAEREAAARRTRNLQYTGIAIAIASVFAFMILLGMFPVSRLTIKMLSFFAFICLFEFIVLLIDTWLHKLAHGEPMKIWLAKIVLIGVLVPVQHFLEHGVVHFLASQRLLRMRQHLSMRKMWVNMIAKIKKPPPPEDVVEIEKDTAVL